MTDLYTKSVLTVIAVALSVIAAQKFLKPTPAVARLDGDCGGIISPYYIATSENPDPALGTAIHRRTDVLAVEVTNWSSSLR